MIVLIHRLSQPSSNAVSASLSLYFSTRHTCPRPSCDWCFLAVILLALLSVRLPLISRLTFLLTMFGRCCICAQNTPVIVRRASCDITVISPLISVFLGRLRLLHSSCSVWQRKRSSIFSSHVIAFLSLNFDCASGNFWVFTYAVLWCLFLNLIITATADHYVLKSVFENILTSKVGVQPGKNRNDCITTHPWQCGQLIKLCVLGLFI